MKIGAALVDSITAVTKEWTKVKRQEIRDAAAGARARDRYWRAAYREDAIKTIAYRVMPEAYRKASGGGQFPATARQVMYAARPMILAETSKPLNDVYFTQQLLPGFQEAYPDVTANWDVVYDARGHLYEPHTDREIALGTLDVRSYLHRASTGSNQIEPSFTARDATYPTTGPTHRYRNVLFIEKEGFLPLLQRAQIGARFDLALMSTKGMASTAARSLMEGLSYRHEVCFFVLHDFDKAGFSIRATLTRATDRFRFRHRPQVVDLGLRLADVQAEGLEPEPCLYHEFNPATNLRRNGATADEVAFLVQGSQRGQRVELNALSSDRFVVWLESKLTAAGVAKFVPDDDTLVAAFRRAVYIHAMNEALEELDADAQAEAEEAEPPAKLADVVRSWFAGHPSAAWDQAIADAAADARKS